MTGGKIGKSNILDQIRYRGCSCIFRSGSNNTVLMDVQDTGVGHESLQILGNKMARETIDNVPLVGNIRQGTQRAHNLSTGNIVSEENKVSFIERLLSPLDADAVGGDRKRGESEESEGEKTSGEDHDGFGDCVAGSWRTREGAF